MIDRQYEMFCKVTGKYSPRLPEVLVDDGFEVKAVLDLGCGSGCWYVHFIPTPVPADFVLG